MGTLPLPAHCAVLGTRSLSPSESLLHKKKPSRSKTKENKTKQKKTKQNKRKQNKIKQNKIKQNKTKQNKTKLHQKKKKTPKPNPDLSSKRICLEVNSG